MAPRFLHGGTRSWRIFLVVAAVVLYGIAVSGRAYNATTPVTLPFHELLRKIYALLAFALLGFALERSNLRRANGVAGAGIVIALYSYAIELGQIFISHSTETFAEHSFDVASGLVGGALGAFVALLISARAARARRTEALALAVMLALLAWAFTVTYARLDRVAPTASGSRGGRSAAVSWVSKPALRPVPVSGR
jgi:VanZ family protein